MRVDLPDYKGRVRILNVHARNKKLATEVSIETIARRTPGFSRANLANLLNEAAILTARRHKSEITMCELNDAIDLVLVVKKGTPLVDSKSKRLIAYHQVGYAIVGTLLKDHEPVEKVTIIPRGRAQGLTWFTPYEEQGLITKAQLMARIAVAMGGRAAEEEVFGDDEVTTGAGENLQRATTIAIQIVTRFGMSELGPLSLEGQSGEVFLGNGLMNRAEYSEKSAARIDAQVKAIAEHGHQIARQIIRDNREVIDRLVDLLIEEQTIDGEEFRQIVAQYTIVPEKEQ